MITSIDPQNEFCQIRDSNHLLTSDSEGKKVKPQKKKKKNMMEESFLLALNLFLFFYEMSF